MEAKENREINVKLERETLMSIKNDFKTNSFSETQLDEYNRQIAVLEKEVKHLKETLEQLVLNDEQRVKLKKEKEENETLLNKYYTLREELEKQIKAEENK